jgi:hypothetical protein
MVRCGFLAMVVGIKSESVGKKVARPARISEAVPVRMVRPMNVLMKPIFLDCLIVLAAVAALAALSFFPLGPWLYLPAVLVVLSLATKALRTFNPIPPDTDSRASQPRDTSSSGGER